MPDARLADTVRAPLALGVVAAGGAIGAAGRYVTGELIPLQPRAIPWATLLVNGTGCFAMGVLMVVIGSLSVGQPRVLLRLFLGTGVLGGFTTFSAYTAEIRALAADGAVTVAAGYLAGSVVSCLAAVVLGMACARWAAGSGRRLP